MGTLGNLDTWNMMKGEEADVTKNRIRVGRSLLENLQREPLTTDIEGI